MNGPAPDVTTLLATLRGNNPEQRRAAEEQLFHAVEPELRRLAEAYFRREWHADPLVQPTLLLNEAFVRLMRGRSTPESRTQFFGFAARIMRQILVEHARKPRTAGLPSSLDLPAPERPLDLLALDEALARLEELDPRSSRVVELRFFGGLTWEEIAGEIGCCPATAKNDWRFARDWLHKQIYG
jgi:RNA polymerase sigma factor (TIGR02999 family)